LCHVAISRPISDCDRSGVPPAGATPSFCNTATASFRLKNVSISRLSWSSAFL